MNDNSLKRRGVKIDLSLFRSSKDILPTTVNLESLCEAIREGRWKAPVVECRNILSKKDSASYKRFRSTALPHFGAHVLVSTRAKGRNDKDRIKAFTGLCQLDFDDLSQTEIETLRTKAENDEHIAAAFVSPSGRGFKMLLQVPVAGDRAEYIKIATSAREYASAVYEMPPEHGTLVDVMRLCCVSYDDQCLFRNNAVPIQVSLPPGTRHGAIVSMAGSFVANGYSDEEAFTLIREQIRDEDKTDSEIRSAIAYCADKQKPRISDAPSRHLFEDLSPYLDGDHKPLLPTVAEIGKDRCLFYSQAINEIHGEPGIGKTNILLAASKCVLESGGRVVYIDPEDTPSRIVSRALSLGLDPESLRNNFKYLHDPDPERLSLAQQWALDEKPCAVMLDGLAECLARENKDENDVTDVLCFFRERLRPFSEAGAAVVVADHVAKAPGSRGRWARGSGAKLGHYTGVSYEVKLSEPYTPTQSGSLQLKVSKDRHGGVGPMGALIAELRFTPDNKGRTEVSWSDESGATLVAPTPVKDRIVSFLSRHGFASKRDLRGLGKAQHVDQAIRSLLLEGRAKLDSSSKKHRYILCDPKESDE